ncbi:hypothetical protein K3152_13510 [Qipengyuania sp. 1NDH17]|uniref:Uncharacterized protein n=1 Tax=Qipengyuania polymorpha TaxID=2867234 RepID=A0ABS7J4J1_9SPHN|nr:hypothetical protein [Qipengyuania polymorpha]MBX7459265.1 hypothetical protein [Qipengyuania polymorpha]
MAEYELQSTGDDEADNVNLPVLLALTGGKIDSETTSYLAEVLRSDYALSPTLRQILADALDGESNDLRLTLARKGKTGPLPKQPPLFKAMVDWASKMAWGQFISEHPESDIKLENAIQDACEHFDIQRSEAFAGLKVWREVHERG